MSQLEIISLLILAVAVGHCAITKPQPDDDDQDPDADALASALLSSPAVLTSLLLKLLEQSSKQLIKPSSQTPVESDANIEKISQPPTDVFANADQQNQPTYQVNNGPSSATMMGGNQISNVDGAKDKIPNNMAANVLNAQTLGGNSQFPVDSLGLGGVVGGNTIPGVTGNFNGLAGFGNIDANSFFDSLDGASSSQLNSILTQNCLPPSSSDNNGDQSSIFSKTQPNLAGNNNPIDNNVRRSQNQTPTLLTNHLPQINAQIASSLQPLGISSKFLGFEKMPATSNGIFGNGLLQNLNGGNRNVGGLSGLGNQQLMGKIGSSSMPSVGGAQFWLNNMQQTPAKV